MIVPYPITFTGITDCEMVLPKVGEALKDGGTAIDALMRAVEFIVGL
jgi:hypothetical protein